MSTPLVGVSRRSFLGQSACNAAGLAAGLVGLTAGVSIPSVAERVRLGVIGVRRQGRKLALELARLPGAEVVSLCDVDDGVLDRAIREVEETGARPRREREFRRLLDDPRLDAIVIATPDHSHAAIAIEALQARKDVYLETPVCHTLEEGKILRQIASESGRIVQCGLFDRSLPHVRNAIEFVLRGEIGSVPLVKAWAVHRRTSGVATGSIVAPSGIDYAAWLYPTPERPFDPQRFHRNWSSFWDYGSGELGLWGVSLLDLACWGLGAKFPERIVGVGGRIAEGAAEVPDMLHVTYGYRQATILWEHRQWSNHPLEGRNAGVAFYGERGTLVLDRGGWKVYDGPAMSEDGRADLAPHLIDFLNAVRSRREPVAPLETGITASALCHLGNLAYRLGRELRLGPDGDWTSDADAVALARGRYRPEIPLGSGRNAPPV
jgi:predicted dehydrogenase